MPNIHLTTLQNHRHQIASRENHQNDNRIEQHIFKTTWHRRGKRANLNPVSAHAVEINPQNTRGQTAAALSNPTESPAKGKLGTTLTLLQILASARMPDPIQSNQPGGVNSQSKDYNLIKSRTKRISNGEPMQARSNLQRSVVTVINIKDKKYCSGAFISPQNVVTAAHCFANSKGGELNQNAKIKFSGHSYPCSSVSTVNNATTFDTDRTPDVAVCHLAATVPNALPLPIADKNHLQRRKKNMQAADLSGTPKAFTVGNGLSGNECDGAHERGHTISWQHPESYARGAHRDIGEFTSAAKKDGTFSNTCKGDSGSPILVLNKGNGKYELSSILSESDLGVTTDIPFGMSGTMITKESRGGGWLQQHAGPAPTEPHYYDSSKDCYLDIPLRPKPSPSDQKLSHEKELMLNHRTTRTQYGYSHSKIKAEFTADSVKTCSECTAIPNFPCSITIPKGTATGNITVTHDDQEWPISIEDDGTCEMFMLNNKPRSQGTVVEKSGRPDACTT